MRHLRVKTIFYEATGKAITGEELFQQLTAQQKAVVMNPQFKGPGPGGY